VYANPCWSSLPRWVWFVGPHCLYGVRCQRAHCL
jgi:hypothetical protein